ncbi:MAG TPA: proline racemase family protein [Vicinamibacterales bacterium]|nr:proline racemase family protein [Vicinamibacterales bacterium]
MIHRIRTIDAHAAGEPLRLVVEGLPSPEGATMLEKRAWARKHLDHLRRAIMLEPRGHADMYGALLTEPVTPGAHAGVLFMHNEGWSTMCGHGVVAVTTIAIERDLIWPGGPALVLDSPAGPVEARAAIATDRDGTRHVSSVSFRNVASFVFEAGLPVKLNGRTLLVDVAFGGAFYAIVDAEAAGLPVDGARLPDLRRLGMAVKDEVERLRTIVHPLDAGLEGIYGTIFTAPAQHPDAHLRNVTIFADAEVDRSPCGTGTAAVMAVLSEMGVLDDDAPFVHESIVGTLFRGRIIGRLLVGDRPAIVPEIQGSAWITGEHTFLIDGDDPLKAGFRLGG